MRHAVASRLALPILVSSLLLTGCGDTKGDDAAQAAVDTCAALGHPVVECHAAFLQGYTDQAKASAPIPDGQVRAAWGDTDATQLGYVAGVRYATEHP